MNDFSELENELRKLRPKQPSPVLFERVEQAFSKSCRASAEADAKWSWRRFTEIPYNWLSLGFGLAAAAVLIVFAVLTMEHQHGPREIIAQNSPAPETRTVPLLTEQARASKFVPAGGTHVVYNARDEGLHFADGSERPLRRVRYETQQSWRWRNPETGESLRVSYPSEEIVLIPVSGQ
jgi:hypothetical protein